MRIGNVAKFFAVTVLAGQAIAQTSLVGFTAAGEMIEIDAATGEGTLIADLGMAIVGATNTGARSVWALRADGAIIGTDPATGDWNVVMEPTGFPVGYLPVAIDRKILWEAATGSLTTYLFIVVRPPSGYDELYRVATARGVYEFVGTCGVNGIVGLSSHTAITSDGRQLYLSYLNGNTTLQASYLNMETVGCVIDDLGGWPMAGGTSLWSLDYSIPSATPIGVTGFGLLTGLAEMPPKTLCEPYVDCDSGLHYFGPDIFDFLCWQNRFVSGDPYACDCDMSTGVGVCDIFDMLCFQGIFVKAAGGC